MKPEKTREDAKMSYTLIKRAKKNVGDFLIWERAKELIGKFTGEREFLVLEGWKSLSNRLAEINKTKAVIICGGPGYQKDFYPRVYPFLRHIHRINVPIIPFGLGWGGEPMHRAEKFSFNDSSESILRYIHKRCSATSCRDVITKDILDRYGFRNAVMTGDPAWYDLESIGRSFETPENIDRIVVTPPARDAFYKQAITLMRRLRNVFRASRFFLVFHRGIKSDKYTSKGEAMYLQKLKRKAEEMNYVTVNAAYDTSRIRFYKKCDLHVGYRVHGHTYFLSIRKPSFLLQEDGRGLGLSRSFGLPDVPARGHMISESVYQTTSLPKRVSNALDRALFNLVIHPSVLRDSVEVLIKNIETERMNGFPSFRNLSKLIDDHYYPVMSEFLKTLP